jgi:hypothetical protein
MESFYNAFLPPSVSICGYDLKSFSYNHLVILRAINSPFTDSSAGAIASAADLITALKVCSTGYPEKDFNFTRKDRFNSFLLARQRVRLMAECINFSSYIGANQQVPQFWEFKGKGWKPSSCPEELSTITLLIKNNIDHSEAWNMSIGYANWLSAVILEQAGNPRVFIDDDETSPIDFNNIPEDEAQKIAMELLPPEKFKSWLKARKEKGSI